ncbi:ferric iron reductase FhuF-like transporter [Ancylobacter aquaticus]|uniref:Ferric iron reductase FhuF-like transporter n=2 Tax=Ancylobacter aquaticus TaxID=100 RepID=A0A4R1I6U7_ANCAQ|nr:ferric iron reductase FhuF-like transporter [Ancylobacter aquaticus]
MSGWTDDRENTTAAARELRAAFGVMAQHWPLPQVEIGPMAPGFMPVPALFADDRFLAKMLARQQAGTPGLDAKGAAAYFISEYAGVLGIAAASPYLSHGLVPAFVPENCALAFELPAEGRPRVRLRLLDPRCVTGRPGQSRHGASCRPVDREGLRSELREGLEAHMEPLIHRLRGRTGLPWQAMWRLVSDSVAARFLEAGRQFGCEEEAQAEALAILKAPGSPLANRQLHFFEIVIRDEASPGRIVARRSFRARGGCCRFYTAPGGSYCSSCVLVTPHERRRRIEAQMRHRLGLPALEDTASADAAQPKDLSS